MKLTLAKVGVALAAISAVLSLTATVANADSPSWCGAKKASIAFLDGFGGNSWRRITTASAKEEAQKCPSITGYEYADGQGNTQKAISDIKSMAAKGTDALVVFGDAGPAVLPALTSVFKAGKVVVPYRVEVGGKEGENYTKWIGASFKNDGQNWGKWIKSILPSGGNLLFLSGPAGNSQGKDELEGLKSVLGPEYKFINPAPFDVTNWDPALIAFGQIGMNDAIGLVRLARNINIDFRVHPFRHQPLKMRPGIVKTGQPARLAIRIKQLHRGDCLKRAKIAESRKRSVVPKNPVAAAGNQKRHNISPVVLPKVQIIALDVQQPQLIFSQSVQRLVCRSLPSLLYMECLLALHFRGRNRSPAVLLSEDRLALSVEKSDRSGSQVHSHLELCSRDCRFFGVTT